RPEIRIVNPGDPQPLIKAARNLRIEALALLPKLTESLKGHVENMITNIKKATGAGIVVITAADQDRSVEELQLSVRTYNCLKNANIKTIGELVLQTENDLLQTQNFGRKSLHEINEVLAGLGFSLGMKYDTDGNLVKPESQSA